MEALRNHLGQVSITDGSTERRHPVQPSTASQSQDRGRASSAPVSRAPIRVPLTRQEQPRPRFNPDFVAALPTNVDRADYPNNVLSSLRLNPDPPTSRRWCDITFNAECCICHEGSAREALFATDCCHLYHQHCWTDHAAQDESHPLQPQGGQVMDEAVLCHVCRRSVISYNGERVDRLDIRIPQGARHGALPHHYRFGLPPECGVSIDIVNRRVLEQASGSPNCGRHAIHNISRQAQHLSLCDNDASRSYHAVIRHWTAAESDNRLPPPANMNAEDLLAYIESSGLQGLQGTLIYEPTQRATVSQADMAAFRSLQSPIRMGENDLDPDFDRVFRGGQGQLAMIINTGGHWIAVEVSFNRVDRIVDIVYMESVDSLNNSSIAILHRYVVPAIRRQLQLAFPAVNVVEAEPHPAATNRTAPRPSEVIAEQDAEYAESLRQDQERDQQRERARQAESERSRSASPEQPSPAHEQPSPAQRRQDALRRFQTPSPSPAQPAVPIVNPAPTAPAGPAAPSQAPAPYRRRDEFFSAAHHGTTLPQLPPRNRGRSAQQAEYIYGDSESE